MPIDKLKIRQSFLLSYYCCCFSKLQWLFPVNKADVNILASRGGNVMTLSFFHLLHSVIDTEKFQIFPQCCALINMFLFWYRQLKPSTGGCKPFHEGNKTKVFTSCLEHTGARKTSAPPLGDSHVPAICHEWRTKQCNHWLLFFSWRMREIQSYLWRGFALLSLVLMPGLADFRNCLLSHLE